MLFLVSFPIKKWWFSCKRLPEVSIFNIPTHLGLPSWRRSDKIPATTGVLSSQANDKKSAFATFKPADVSWDLGFFMIFVHQNARSSISSCLFSDFSSRGWRFHAWSSCVAPYNFQQPFSKVNKSWTTWGAQQKLQKNHPVTQAMCTTVASWKMTCLYIFNGDLKGPGRLAHEIIHMKNHYEWICEPFLLYTLAEGA